jgi:Glycosyltransferase family 87
VFDALCVLLLWVLGRRAGGRTLGIALAYAWVAFPFTLYVSNTNSNDALVPLSVLLALIFVAHPASRGSATAIAGLTKFAPLALAPLLAMHERRVRPALIFCVSFGLASAVLLFVFADDLGTFWDRTIAFQSDRDSPFSLWGLHDLDLAQPLVQAGAVLLAVVLAFVPRRRDLGGLAALCAAVLLALQLGVEHWFYLYIVWFFPLVMLALLAPSTPAEPPRSPPREVALAHTG